VLKSLHQNQGKVQTHFVTFPLHGQSRRDLQKYFVRRLEKRSMRSIGAPSGKMTHFLIDDFHRSEPRSWEFLRLLLDHEAIYEEDHEWTRVEKVTLILTANSDFQQELCPRLSRHFCQFSVRPLTQKELLHVYRVGCEITKVIKSLQARFSFCQISSRSLEISYKLSCKLYCQK